VFVAPVENHLAPNVPPGDLLAEMVDHLPSNVSGGDLFPEMVLWAVRSRAAVSSRVDPAEPFFDIPPTDRPWRPWYVGRPEESECDDW